MGEGVLVIPAERRGYSLILLLTKRRVLTDEELNLMPSRFSIDGFVYDLTPWLGGHPGGSAILIRQAGKDASTIFKAIQHSEYAVKESKKYIVGRLAEKAKL